MAGRANGPTRRPRQLISLAEAAKYADVGSRTIRRYIATGRLRAYKVGPRLVKVDIDDLDALLRPIPARAAVGGRAKDAA